VPYRAGVPDPTSPLTRTPRVARFDELTARELHDLLRLRVDVFVVEQECAYPELDGRDTEPGTEHVWFADDAGPTAYLRVLAEPDGGVRIGRVVTRADVRGSGAAARLVADVLARHDGTPAALEAQSYLVGFYARFGFAPAGPEYVEDGIPHVPMRRPAR
jgi:ElaA protein